MGIYRNGFLDRLLTSASVLKIDVEGAELEVLRAFETVILSANPIILMEILTVYNEGNTLRVNRQLEIQSLLSEANYGMYRVVKDGFRLAEIKPIVEIEIHSDLEKCDYVMVPNSKDSIFREICFPFMK